LTGWSATAVAVACPYTRGNNTISDVQSCIVTVHYACVRDREIILISRLPGVGREHGDVGVVFVKKHARRLRGPGGRAGFGDLKSTKNDTREAFNISVADPNRRAWARVGQSLYASLRAVPPPRWSSSDEV
jgi:hypothetical protein